MDVKPGEMEGQLYIYWKKLHISEPVQFKPMFKDQLYFVYTDSDMLPKIQELVCFLCMNCQHPWEIRDEQFWIYIFYFSGLEKDDQCFS